MENELKLTKKSPQKRIISSSVLFALAIIAFVFYLIFFFEIIEGMKVPDEDADLGSGLQIALGIIFSLIFGAVQLVLSAFSVLFSVLARRVADTKDRRKTNIIIALNAILALISAVSFTVIVIIS